MSDDGRESRQASTPPSAHKQAVPHRVVILPQVLARLNRKRGRQHPFSAIDGRRAAHVVVDLQVAYLEPGAPMEIPAARAIVRRVNTVSRAMRAAGGVVVFLQHTVDDDALRSWSVYYDHIVGAERRAVIAAGLGPGTNGHALWPRLDIQDADWRIAKRRFGAFMPGSSDLHDRLQAHGIDTLVITGTATNCCCETTAREAMALNYRTFVISDATATDTDDEHNASLSILLNTFADVRTTRAVVGLLRA